MGSPSDPMPTALEIDDDAADGDPMPTTLKINDDDAGSTTSQPPRRRRYPIFTSTLLLLVFFESINPPESYIYQFFDRAKHIPRDDIHRHAIPFFTYGQLFGFLPLTLLSEFAGKCCYVIGLGLSLRIGSSLLHWLGPAVWLLPHQIARGMYGLASASKVAIKTHAYANLPHEVYIAITGYMRAVNLVAHVMGAFLGYVFYSSKLDWSVAFSVQVACLLVAIIAFLGNVAYSTATAKGGSASKSAEEISSFREFIAISWNTYRTNRTLAVITIWAIAIDSVQLCFQTQKSALINAVDVSAKSNGLAVAACRLSSAIVALCIGRYPHLVSGFCIEWLYAAAVAVSMTAFMAGYSWNVFMVYSAFLMFGVITDAFMCITTAHIALESPTSLRGWILFGNQFLAITMASLIQFVFGSIFSLEIRWFYFGLAIIVLTIPMVLLPVSSRNSV